MRKNFFLFSLMLALLLTFSLTTSNQTYAYPIDKNHNVYGWIVGGYYHGLDSKRGNYDNGAVDGFYLHGLRLGVNGYAFDKVFYDVQLKGENLAAKSFGIESAWITFEQFGPYLNITFGGLPIKFNRSYNDTSGFKQGLKNRAIGDTFFGHYDDLGILLSGNIPVLGALKYWIGIWNGQGGPSTGTGALGGDGTLTLTARVQVDFNKSWKNGDEYFEKDWNATLGVGFYYGNSTNNAATTNTIGQWGQKSTTVSGIQVTHGGAKIMGLTLDAGFHYDTLIFVEGSFTSFGASKGKDGATLDQGTAVGWTATIGSVPVALGTTQIGIFARLSKAPINRATGVGGNNGLNAGSDWTYYGISGTRMVLDAALNIFFAKHSLKIQPAFQFELNRKNMAGDTSTKTNYYSQKEASFWLNAQYNF